MNPTASILSRTAGVAVVAMVAAACADRLPTEAPVSPADGAQRTRIDCVAQVHSGEVRCGGPALGRRANLILGGQGVNVRLASSGTVYDTASTTLSTSVTVQNLLNQEIGTPDGVEVTGVNVFFASGPTVEAGTGTVEVLADSVGTFTAANQPYYHYPQIVAPRGLSEAQTWRFRLPVSVTRFVFSVYVETRLAAETGVLRWTRVRGPVVNNSLIHVWGSSPDNVFAVGAWGMIAHYDGVSWSAMPRLTHTILWNVAGSGPRDVWAIGNSEILHYDGNRWSMQQPSVNGLYLSGVAAPEPGHAWVAGYRRDAGTGRDQAVIRHITTPAGEWAETAPPDTMMRRMRGVFAESDTRVWVAGFRYNRERSRYEGLVLHTTDGGGSWNQQVSTHADDRGFLAVWSDGAGRVYAVGEQIDSAGHESALVLRSDDGGESWSETILPSPRNRLLTSVWGVTGDALYAGGSQSTDSSSVEGLMLRSTDGGESWTEVAPGSWPGEVSGIWSSGPNDVYAAAGLELRRFDGASWSKAEGPSGPVDILEDVWSPDGQRVVLVGRGLDPQTGRARGVITRSDDGGATWATAGWPDILLWNVWGTSPADVWAVGSPSNNGTVSILHSVDGGASWVGADPPGAQYREMHGVWANSAGTVFTAGGQRDPATNALTCLILRTPDRGATWHSTTVPGGSFCTLYDVWGSSDSELWAGGTQDDGAGGAKAVVLHSIDGGTTWNPVAVEQSMADAVLGIWAAPGAGVYAVGRRVDPAPLRYTAVVLHSLDGGATWSVERTATTPIGYFVFNGVWGTGPSNVYVVGSEGALLRWNGSSWVDLASGTHDDLLGIFGSSPRDVWVTGFYNTILHGLR